MLSIPTFSRARPASGRTSRSRPPSTPSAGSWGPRLPRPPPRVALGAIPRIRRRLTRAQPLCARLPAALQVVQNLQEALAYVLRVHTITAPHVVARGRHVGGEAIGGHATVPAP